MSTIRTTTLSTVDGTATVPVNTVVNGSAKAWVNFNGTGTVAIRASFNVSSITDNGTGNYSVNFTNAMPDANYSAVVATEESGIICVTASNNAFQQTASVGRIGVFLGTSNSGYDAEQINYTVFR